MKNFTVTTSCPTCNRDGFKNIGGHHARSPKCYAAHLRFEAADARKVAASPRCVSPDFWSAVAIRKDEKAAALEASIETGTPVAIIALPKGHPLRRMWAKAHPGFEA
jgi:hypothetical protein